MIQVTIDQRLTNVSDGISVLQAIRDCGIDIPTLCYIDGLLPYGSCRLCMVTISRPNYGLVPSCARLVEEGMIIETTSEEARTARRMALEFIAGRCPQSKVIQKMAAEAGVETNRFITAAGEEHDELCVLCGLCVRVCKEVIGAEAIGFVNRGEDRKVSTPFDVQAEACVGCGACAAVCPTGAIKIEDKGNERILHTFNTRIELRGCSRCGKNFAPQKMDFVKKLCVTKEPLWDICPKCRRRLTVSELKNLKSEKII